MFLVYAFDSLEQALERGYPNRKYIDEDKDLDRIRRDARFTEMMKKYFGSEDALPSG